MAIRRRVPACWRRDRVRFGTAALNVGAYAARVGVHTGDVSCAAAAPSPAPRSTSACLRDLAHEGQTLLSRRGDLALSGKYLADRRRQITPCGVCIARNGLSSCVIETYA